MQGGRFEHRVVLLGREYNVRFTTKLDAPLLDIEKAVSACSESSLALTPVLGSERVSVLY